MGIIKDFGEKPLTKDDTYREGKFYSELWGKEITVMLFDEEVTLEYAEKCAESMNTMPPELVDKICRAAKLFCVEFLDEISDECREELNLPVDENTPPAEMLKYFTPTVLSVEFPQDPAKTGYTIECNCDWEEEHGMEIDILDNELVFLSEFSGSSPWYDHSDEGWNYAAQI